MALSYGLVELDGLGVRAGDLFLGYRNHFRDRQPLLVVLLERQVGLVHLFQVKEPLGFFKRQLAIVVSVVSQEVRRVQILRRVIFVLQLEELLVVLVVPEIPFEIHDLLLHHFVQVVEVLSAVFVQFDFYSGAILGRLFRLLYFKPILFNVVVVAFENVLKQELIIRIDCLLPFPFKLSLLPPKVFPVADQLLHSFFLLLLPNLKHVFINLTKKLLTVGFIS